MEFFRQARERRAREQAESSESPGEQAGSGLTEFAFDSERIVARRDGRDGWTREARRQLERCRWDDPDLIARARTERLLLAGQRLEDERDAAVAANRAYEQFRVQGRDTKGRRLGAEPKQWVAPVVPEGMVSVTDPDSRHIKANMGYVQGYNAQAVVDEGQIVLAAEITNSTVDFSQLAPMMTAAFSELERAGVSDRPQIALADAQYWNEQHIDEVVADRHMQVLIPPDSGMRRSPRPGGIGGRYAAMRNALAAPAGKELYRQRKQMIEPVFAHTEHNRHITRFLRRGRTAVRTEWRLLMATHNLTKLHRHHLAAIGA